MNTEVFIWICTYGSCCNGDGDGSDESEIVPGIHAMPQGREDKGQRQPVLGGSVVTHPEHIDGVMFNRAFDVERRKVNTFSAQKLKQH